MESGAPPRCVSLLTIVCTIPTILEQVPGPMADEAQSLNQLRQDRLCTFISKIIPQVWFITISS